MAKPVLPVDEIMDILRTSVPRIAALTGNLGPARLHASPGPDVWSVSDLLAHLRASHDVLGGSIVRIVREDTPSWKRLSPRAWMRKTDYPEWASSPPSPPSRRNEPSSSRSSSRCPGGLGAHGQGDRADRPDA